MRLRYFLSALCAAFTLSANAAIPAAEQAVAVEFYHALLDHYFISADPKEINDLDTGVHVGWTRTGYRFSVIKGGSSYAGTSPVCRAYNPTATTHVYSAIKSECDDLKNDKYQGKWIYESDEVFRAFVVDATTGICGADTTPTFRLWNNREDSNHRYTDQVGVFVFMKGKNYIPEGNGNPALPTFFCTPSGGDVVPVANETAPSCTVTANSSTPAVGTTLNLNASCTNNPTSYMWVGCTSTSASCTSTKSASGSASYTLYAANASGPADPVTLTVAWGGGGGGGGGGGAVPICTLSASSLTAVQGSSVTLTAVCSNSPATYEWMLCSPNIGTVTDPTSVPCNLNPSCAATSPTCAVSQAAAGPARYGVDAKNAAGTGNKALVEMAWTGAGGGTPPGGGASVPVCSISTSSTNPATGSSITLTATCSGSPTSYDWIGVGIAAGCSSSPTCTATWNVAEGVTYGVSGINGLGTGGRAYVGVTWTASAPPTPSCTLSASSTTPSVGATITISANCTNSPTSFTWTGCSSTTAACTDSVSTPGPKNYTLIATNAAGNSPQASLQVNWQPLPTAPPACTLTSSSGSTDPYTGTNITLTATCTNSPTSYAWTNCTSTTSTCTTTASSAGSVTYGVTATNVVGTSPLATVAVNWKVSTGGANYCGPNTAYVDIPWGSTTRYLTTAYGGFPQGKVFVFSITVPSSAPHSVNAQQFSPAEYQGPPSIRTMTLSENLCDFSSYLDAASGTAPFIYFNVSSGPGAVLQPGKTYYFNLRNENCPSMCDMSVSIPWK